MTEFIDHHHPTMQAIQRETIHNSNVILWAGYYRYVNHARKLLTTGFKSQAVLIAYATCIRFDTKTLELMTQRYNEYERSNHG